MENMNTPQRNAMAIQTISARPRGSFHQTLDSGDVSAMSASYSAIGIWESSITPQTM